LSRPKPIRVAVPIEEEELPAGGVQSCSGIAPPPVGAPMKVREKKIPVV